VAEELVAQGVDVRTIRLVAVGDSEPIQARRQEPARPGDNRRVEIIIRESLIDDYRNVPPPATAPASTSDAPSSKPIVPSAP